MGEAKKTMKHRQVLYYLSLVLPSAILAVGSILTAFVRNDRWTIGIVSSAIAAVFVVVKYLLGIKWTDFSQQTKRFFTFSIIGSVVAWVLYLVSDLLIFVYLLFVFQRHEFIGGGPFFIAAVLIADLVASIIVFVKVIEGHRKVGSSATKI